MTLPELLTTMAILAFVLSGIMAMFIGGFRSEVDMNQRFVNQQNARLALTAMRKEIRGSCSESVGAAPGEAAGSLVTLGVSCTNGVPASYATWCVDSQGKTAPYTLYRQDGSNCNFSTGTARVDSLACSGATVSCPTPVFTAVVVTGQRPQLQVWLPVQSNLSNNHGLYTLTDTITLRNAGVS